MDAASVMRGFEYYWKHWNVVDQWRRRHHTACEVTHNTIKKMKMETNYHETTEIAVSVDSFEEDESDSIVNNDEHIKSFVNCYSGICSNYEDYEKDDANDDDDGELELEFVINDEMIAFFQQSMIHKMELKKQRELEMKNGDVGQKQNMKVGKKSKNNKMENDEKKW
ncbi:uncharacterized protein LOC142325356 isoform X2 [Lycorma delicatula]|uniref:uncharacterized protein LOC142325356 isoform X2 n=1 Tax=Lycorma delicatula TaxID=130591 RepID=UPI003F50FD60